MAADYEAMRPWASPRQIEVLDALKEHGSQAVVARVLGVAQRSVERILSALSQKAARSGWSPEHDMTKVVAPGFHTKGTSTLYDADGKPKLQWVKTQIDRDFEIAALMDALREVAEQYTGIAKPSPAPERSMDDLLNVYPWGDPHIGLYAWAEETGDRDWDVAKAEAVHVGAMTKLIEMAPPARRCLIAPMGDTQHADNLQNQTTRSGHALDVDTRWPKVFRVIVSTLVRATDAALGKHEIVDIDCVGGNHDDISALALGVVLDAWYRNEPRVNVNLSPSKFRWHRHGLCLIGLTHGDTVKPQNMGQVMAADRAADWGETLYRHIYSGHLHHDAVREFPGVTVETLRTLAPRDAYAAAGGWRSGQDMKCDVWSAKHGRIQRLMVGIERLVES